MSHFARPQKSRRVQEKARLGRQFGFTSWSNDENRDREKYRENRRKSCCLCGERPTPKQINSELQNERSMFQSQSIPPTIPNQSAQQSDPAIGAVRCEVTMIASPCQTNVQEEFSELPQPTRATSTPSSEKNATFFLYCLIVAILDETPHPVKF